MKCEHKNIELWNHSAPYKSEGGWDGSDMNWELSCADCEEVIAEGDGWDSPEKAYKEWKAKQ